MNIFKTDPFVNLANLGMDFVSSSMNFSGMVSSVGSLDSYTGVNSLISNIQHGIEGIAYALMVMFFLFSIFSDAMNETFSFERFFKSFARLFAGMGLITMCPELTKLGDAIADWAQESINVGIDKEQSNTHFTSADFAGFWEALFVAAMVMLVGFFASIIIRVSFYFILFSRLIEMAVRASFMPIAVAMVTDGGWAGSAGRYIKKYVALCLQGPALVLIGDLGGQLLEGAPSMAIGGTGLSGMGSAVFQLGGLIPMIAIAAATIGLAKQSITILNDVMGV